jgi:hypothetical protein
MFNRAFSVSVTELRRVMMTQLWQELWKLSLWLDVMNQQQHRRKKPSLQEGSNPDEC